MDQTLIADRYEIRDLLGRGAGGTVVAAMDHLRGRIVSIRLIRRSGPVAPAALSGALREAQAAGRLRHPGIVAVHDAGLCPDYAWIAHEAVGGETLQSALDRRGPPPLAEALRIMGEMLAALGAAHDLGLAHRDLTPGNILLTGTPGPGWGHARLAGLGSARLGEVLAGQVLATAESHRAADLRAAGLVFQQLLAGAPAFSSRMPGLSAVVNGVLSRPPADHFPEAAAMADAIRVAAMPTAIPRARRGHSQGLIGLIKRKRA